MCAVIVRPDGSLFNSRPIQRLSSPLHTPLDTAIDALIVAIETQHIYLSSKRTWTRKIVILTDGESPIELDEWENTAQAVNDRNIFLTIMCVSIVSPRPSPDAHLTPAGLILMKIRNNFSLHSKTNPILRYPFRNDLRHPLKQITEGKRKVLQ